MTFTRWTVLSSLCAVVLLLAVGFGTAAATDSMGINPNGSIRAVSLGKVTLEGGRELTVACNVTLAGSLAPSTTLTRGETVGRITSFTPGGCTGGTIERTTGLPWTVTYESFLGTLPTALTGDLWRVNRFGVEFNIAGLRCRYEGGLGLLTPLTGSNPYTAGLMSVLAEALALVEGTPCARTVTPRGRIAFSSEETFIEMQGSAMSANPAIVTKAMAGVGATVTITALQAINVTEVAVVNGARGWSVEPTSAAACTRAWAIGNGCGAVVIAAANATSDQLRFKEGTTVLRLIPLNE